MFQPHWDVTSYNKRRVIVIGDSHARGCELELNAKLNTQWKATLVYGVVKPGENCGFCHKGNKCIGKEGHCGSMERHKWHRKNNTEESQKHITDFVDKNRDTKIIVMSAPHRHDLMNSSCVNAEVSRFNRKLKKRMKIYIHVTVLDVELERKHFTKNGLHMI
jgi:hypothetical protein